jgi:DDB1- and CUL4-associated factor 7
MANVPRGQHDQQFAGDMDTLPTYNQPKTPSSAYPHADASRGVPTLNAPGMSLPGALQTGRPGISSSNTAPGSVPTLPPISTTGQYASPSRAATTSHSHSYSHSSPAPTYSDSASTPTHKQYMSVNTAHAPVYSPLGLADIRPRADSTNDEGLMTPNPYLSTQYEPSNCNYLAPWPIYSFDWCKWPAHNQGLGDSAGKMAIGSYLEDGHNYVGWQCHAEFFINCSRYKY